MTEDTTTTDKPATENPEADERPEQNLKAELDRRRKAQDKAERELRQMQDRLNELEDRDKTEVERAKARAERAEQQLSGLMGKVTAMEKGAWVRSAAAELDFHDPEDAVQHLRDNLGNLEDASDARRLVKSLAKNKKHLVKAKEPDGPRPGVNSLFQGAGVPQNGQPGQPGQPGQAPANPAQQAAQREVQLAQGLAAELGKFRDNWQSLG